MSNPMIKIHNAQTGEEVERLMTNDEYADWQKAAAGINYE